MVTRVKSKPGELGVIEQVYEAIRKECGVSKEKFYGSVGAAKDHVIQSDCGLDMAHGFLTGLWVGQRPSTSSN